MALARMTAEGRTLLSQLARSPLDTPDTRLISDLSAFGFAEKKDGRWQITRSGKEYLKTHR